MYFLLLETLLFAACLILYFGKVSRRRVGKLPPGPISWPVVGGLVEVVGSSRIPYVAFSKLSKKYGDILSVHIGSHLFVIVSSLKDMKEIFTRPEVTEDRFMFQSVVDRNPDGFNDLGIAFGMGEKWRDLRRYSMRILRDFGFGKKGHVDELVGEEIRELIGHLTVKAEERNGIVEIDAHDLGASALNCLWSLVAGFRFGLESPETRHYLEVSGRTMELLQFDVAYNVFPNLKKWFPNLSGHERHLKVHKEMRAFMKRIVNGIREKRLSRKYSGAINLVEMFLDKIEAEEMIGSDVFTEDQLVMLLMDLFLGGSDTIGTSLTWTVLFLTLNPEVQDKIKREIKQLLVRVNGDINGLVRFEHLPHLPFTRATMLEVHRRSHFVPIPPPRMASKDFHYEGYLIPKGAAVMWNIYPICMSKELWGDPEAFRPERFLHEDSNKNVDINADIAERISLFGFGRRRCIGESFATDATLLYLANLMRVFTFHAIPGEEPTPDGPRQALTLLPKPFKVRIEVEGSEQLSMDCLCSLQ